MNPVTAMLVRQVGDRKIARFIERWDALEALVIRVYKGARATPVDERLYKRLRPELRTKLRRYGPELDQYWPKATVGGKLAKHNPFLTLLRAEHPSVFVGNWPAMQMLPAARQALNEWLLDQLPGKPE